MQSAGWTLRSNVWRRQGKSLPPIRLVAGDDPLQSQIVVAVTAAWKQAHFQVYLVRLPFPVLIRTNLFPGNFAAAILEWDFGSPDYEPGAFWSGGTALNYGGYDDPLVNALAARVKFSASPAVRDRLRNEIRNRLLSDGAGLGLAPEIYACQISNGLHGYVAPTLVTDAGGLMLGLPQWYEDTRIAFKALSERNGIMAADSCHFWGLQRRGRVRWPWSWLSGLEARSYLPILARYTSIWT